MNPQSDESSEDRGTNFDIANENKRISYVSTVAELVFGGAYGPRSKSPKSSMNNPPSSSSQISVEP
jgi:hypothetical protein